MLILLPPSEGKTAPVHGRPLDLASLSFPTLSTARAEVLQALVDLCTTDTSTALDSAAKVLGTGTTLSSEVARNARLASVPATRAHRVYTGVLYEALDLTSLRGSAKRRANSWLAVVSGLFGLVRPGDRIPAYRLSGNVSLPGVGSLSSFWRTRLDEAVRQAAGQGLIVDLRSSTYTSFWRPGPDLARRVVTLRVLHESNGARQVISHFNKATKGRIVRAMLEDDAVPGTPARLAAQLTALGWQTELRGTRKNGTALDVVLTQI